MPGTLTFFNPTSLTELVLLAAAFVLCGLIGIERQFHQKAAGFRSHVLVGTGAAGFTLVSAFGFSSVLGSDVNLDPSRIAAQIVSGIGFLGAGVIFTRSDVVRGLTTAATIWMSAAVGMACGAGMLFLGVSLTCLHLLGVIVIRPLVRRLPAKDRRRVLRVTYADGAGVLRRILTEATLAGYSVSVIGTSRRVHPENGPEVRIDIKFLGGPAAADLIPALAEIDGVTGVRIPSQEHHSDDQDD